MEKKNIKPSGYWNVYENCKNEALKYDNIKEFANKCSAAYHVIRRNNWYDELFSHMIKKHETWTIEKCKIEALKYVYKTDFRKNSKNAYAAIIRNNWWDIICKHLIVKFKQTGYWTFERCKKEASKYECKKDFIKKSGSAYNKARVKKWIPIICKHMKPLGNLHKRLIYVAIFPDNNVYVGLTYDIKKRYYYYHLRSPKSQIFKHIEKTKTLPVLNILTEYLNVSLAKEMEIYYMDIYEKTGFKLLNIAKGGGIGGNISIWSYEECKKEASKYKSRCEFRDVKGGAYNSARKNGWLDDICSHMKTLKLPNGHWNNKENCRLAALESPDRTFFKENYTSAYAISYKNGWLDEIISHLERKNKSYWKSKENCKKAALTTDSRAEFGKKFPTAYKFSRKNKWMDDICSHMKNKKVPNGYWNKENCMKIACSVNNKQEFKKTNRVAYESSYKNNWLDEFFPTNRN